jgi:polyferredoxin
MLFFGIAMIFISPILTYFYGKRWYCSWVCGWVWQKRLVIVIDIYPVRQTHPGKLNDG